MTAILNNPMFDIKSSVGFRTAPCWHHKTYNESNTLVILRDHEDLYYIVVGKCIAPFTPRFLLNQSSEK